MHAPWTISIIANIISVAPRIVRRWLEGTKADSWIAVKGADAKSYAFHSLPVTVQEKLRRVAAERQYQDVDAMACDFSQGWKAPLPLSEVPAVFKHKAARYRDSLAALLMQRSEFTWPQLVATASGRVALSEKQASRILDRAIWRDGGLEQWQRLELWLDEKAFQNSPARRPAAAPRTVFNHKPLEPYIETLVNKSAPTMDDRDYLFHVSFHHLEVVQEARDPRQRRAAKNSLLAYLHSALPGLTPQSSEPLAVLRRTFERRYIQWVAGGRTIRKDQRPANSGAQDYICPDCDRKIHDQAVHLRGNVTLAYRLLRRKGHLCAECQERYTFNVRLNKSYMANSLRERTTPNELTMAQSRGDWEGRMTGPYIPRKPDDIAPGDWFVADDETPNHVVYHEVDGQRIIGRVQCLVMLDMRTGYPLDFYMYFGPVNSRAIRRLCYQVYVHGVGLPRIGNYFEKSAWASRMVAGVSKEKDWYHFRETEAALEQKLKFFGCPFDQEERGLKERGLDLQVRHATTPRAKSQIEGFFHIGQKWMSHFPGYVGFNERLESMERNQSFIAKAKRGQVDPAKGMLSLTEFRDNYRNVLEDYAQEPQNGSWLRGASPFEMWSDYTATRPLNKLPLEMRYLLSTHKKAVRVKPHGIVIPVSRYENALYCNEQTGKLIGKEVLAYYNIDYPELLTVMNPKTRETFTVDRVLLPSMTATPEQFSKVQQQIKGHMATVKGIVGNLSHPLINTIVRDTDFPDAAKDFGQYVNTEIAQHKERASARQRQVNKIQRDAFAAGIPVNAQIRNPDRVQQGLDREKEIRERMRKKKEQSSSPHPTL